MEIFILVLYIEYQGSVLTDPHTSTFILTAWNFSEIQEVCTVAISVLMLPVKWVALTIGLLNYALFAVLCKLANTFLLGLMSRHAQGNACKF